MVARVLIRGGASAAMRVSLPGFDVNVANLSQLAFDARFANLQIYRRGIVYINGAGADNTFSFGETLPGPPLGFFVFNELPNGAGQSPFVVANYGGSPGATFSYVVLTSSAMTFQAWQTGSGIPVKYVLFRPLGA